MSRAAEAFERLVEIMDALRSPGGCPWDGEQTHRSLVRYLIEESYEVVEAIEDPGGVDRALLREELGDVLLQVVFHARIAEEVPAASGGFDVADVVEELNAKLVRRHPHVFAADDAADDDGADDAADAGAASIQPAPTDATNDAAAPASAGAAGDRRIDEQRLESLTRRWDAIKREEKPERSDPFDGVPPALPALALAEKTLNKAAKAGLPLPSAETAAPSRGLDVRDPAGAPHSIAASVPDGATAPGAVAPAAAPAPPAVEVSPESVAAGGREEAERALGEELLALTVRARSLGVDPERALRGAVRGFVEASRTVGKA